MPSAAALTDTTVSAITAATSAGAFYPSNVNRSSASIVQTFSYKAQLTFANSDTFVALPAALPAGHVIRFAQMNFDTAVGLATAVKVALGTSGDPDAVLLSGTTVTKNIKTMGSPLTDIDTTTATTYRVSCVATGGTAAGTFNAAANISVYIVFDVYPILPDAP